MTTETYQIVGRMEALWPHQLHGLAMHGRRAGGDLSHCRNDLVVTTRALIGDRDWKEAALQRVEAMRQQNFLTELEGLRARKRRKDIAARLLEGPRDPWSKSKHGPIREMILTANRAFFDSDPTGALEAQFEKQAVSWLKKTFGEDVIHARADHDEAAYHIHAVIMPVARTKDGREMLQPSKHAVIKDYEKFQDEIGLCFADLGLHRGREWAREARAARARGEVEPEAPRHRRTADWRKAEEIRLEAEREELERREKRYARQLAAEAARLAEHQREIDVQAAEQDAFAATAEALEAGLITPDEPTTFRSASGDARAQGILARIKAAKPGYHRFVKLMTPVWAKMQSRADAAAEAKVEKDRAEIETAWTSLDKIARTILPSLDPIAKPRETVARIIAWWKTSKARDEQKDQDKKQRD